MNISLKLMQKITYKPVDEVQVYKNMNDTTILYFWPHFWWFKYRQRFSEAELVKHLEDWATSNFCLLSTKRIPYKDTNVLDYYETTLYMPEYYTEGYQSREFVFKNQNKTQNIIDACEFVLMLMNGCETGIVEVR